jgi:hypothetical protein
MLTVSQRGKAIENNLEHLVYKLSLRIENLIKESQHLIKLQ